MTTTLKNIDVDAAQLFTTVAAFGAYLLAGKATVTVYNAAAGARFTYRVRVERTRTERGGYVANHASGGWEVEVRTAWGWAKIGMIKRGRVRLFWNPLRWLPEGVDAEAQAAFGAQVARLHTGERWPDHVLVWREHSCGRCGADLTSEYRLIGYGPECCNYIGVDGRVVLKTLAGCSDPSRAIEVARALVYHGWRSRTDDALLQLLPGIAGEYARNVQAMQAGASSQG